MIYWIDVWLITSLFGLVLGFAYLADCRPEVKAAPGPPITVIAIIIGGAIAGFLLLAASNFPRVVLYGLGGTASGVILAFTLSYLSKLPEVRRLAKEKRDKEVEFWIKKAEKEFNLGRKE